MAINVIVPSNLGKTIKANLLAPNKYDVNIDGTTLVADVNGVIKTSLDPEIINSLVGLTGLPALSNNLGTFTGNIIPDGVTIKSALQAIETAIESVNVVGQFVGSSATFAGLPVATAEGNPVNISDWSILTVDDGLNPAGIYMYNGTSYVLVTKILYQFTLPAISISPMSSDSIGLIGTIDRYAREDHRHPAQLPSSDKGNLLTVGTDGLSIVKTSDVTNLASVELKDAFDVVHLGWILP